jgi:hypothetical protein
VDKIKNPKVNNHLLTHPDNKMAQERTILINKKTGNVFTTFDEITAPIMKKLGTLNVQRVSNIDFDNADQKWKAVTKDENKEVIVEGSAEEKKKVYSEEAEWANKNVKKLVDKHFPDKSIQYESE